MDHHRKDLCCGEYPDRLPYDSMNRECCRMESFDDNTSTFDVLVPWATCEERGGSIVENNELV